MMDFQEIKQKAEYCLNCTNKPCTKGCPLGNDIPEFINCAKNNEFEEAYRILTNTTVLAPICGTICPHEKQCQGNCVRGIKGEPVSIGDIETFIGEMAIENNYEIRRDDIYNEKNNKIKIAIVGSGPAGLTCAAFLARRGYDVTIYEKHSELGGLLRYGIPDFRLGKELLDKQIKAIVDLGIKVVCNKTLGRDFSLDWLQNEYDAVFLAFGANVSRRMGIVGEELDGVFGGNELLEDNLHPDYTGKKVAVIGGGNVAMDVSRTAKRLGADKVYVIYRRAEEQMPAEKKEIMDAKIDGVEFLFQNNIVKINGGLSDDGNRVASVECVKTRLVEKSGADRLVPVDVENSNYLLDVDYVLMAIGAKVNSEVLSKLNLRLNKWGYIDVDENYMTSLPGVFAGGDLIGTNPTVAWAARDGRNAADAICNFF